MNMMLGFNKT